MNNYLAITIGPVLETLLSARKTRELWAGSYLLSYISRELMRNIRNEMGGENILLPAVTCIDQPNYLGAGLYPDRIYISVSDSKTDVGSIIENVLSDIAKSILKCFEQNNGKKVGKEDVFTNLFEDTEAITNYLRHYFKIYHFNLEIKPDKNIVEELANLCDTLDLQNRVIANEPANLLNPLKLLFNLANWSFLFEDGFGVQYGNGTHSDKQNRMDWKNSKTGELAEILAMPRRRFESLIEVGTRQLRAINAERYDNIIKKNIENDKQKKNDELDEEDEIIIDFQKPENFKKDFKPYHKYVAIVHCDGDNVGKIIGTVGTTAEGITRFSEKMTEFASSATEMVVEYGGAPIYMGGDDMLFLAPVATQNYGDAERKNIFDLITLLDAKFKVLIHDEYHDAITEHFAKKKNTDTPSYPTLSYGISVTYYKYPLYEAKGISYEALKFVKNKTPKKNAIKVDYMTHSGHLIPFLVDKKSPKVEMLADGRTQMENESVLAGLKVLLHKTNESSFLNSFTYKLEMIRPLVTECAQDVTKLQHLFENSFNENYKNHKPFYLALGTFINLLYRNNANIDQNMWDTLYGALRFMNLLNQNETDTD